MRMTLRAGDCSGNLTHFVGMDTLMRPSYWGISSVGRALAWHARGRRFESCILHLESLVICRENTLFPSNCEVFFLLVRLDATP